MESSLSIAVIVVVVGLSNQMILVVADSPLSLADCHDNQYKINNGNQCTDCPECPAGQEYTKNCGYIEEINGKISKNGKGCKECAPGYHKSSASPYECEECRKECPEGTRIIYPCNKTHDMKCSKCSKGFYTAFDGSCVRCSPCCGKPSIYIKHFMQKECKDAGMGSCSCRPLQNCIDRTGDCRKGFLKFSTENPSVETSLSPMTTSSTRTTLMCDKGFYTAPDGSCVRCSFCCGKRTARHVQKECKDAGMGQCSCRPLRSCVDNNGICTRATPATITAASQRRKSSRKKSKYLNQNQKFSGVENKKQKCRNKAILRQLLKLLSKYEERVVLKISVDLKQKKERISRRKRRDTSSPKKRSETSRDQRLAIGRDS